MLCYILSYKLSYVFDPTHKYLLGFLWFLSKIIWYLLFFQAAIGAKSEESFHRDLTVPTASTRLYQMTSLSGEFHVEEIVCPYLNETVSNVMSFNQTDLYKVEQPGM